MADTYVLIAVKVEDRDYASIPELAAAKNENIGNALVNLVTRINGRASKGSLGFVAFSDAGTNADGAIACTQANAEDETVTFELGGLTVVLTEGVDFDRGASDTTCGAALADAINADPVLRAWVTATAATGTVTVEFNMPGQVGHDLDLTTSEGTAFGLTQIGAGTAGDPGSSAQAWKGQNK